MLDDAEELAHEESQWSKLGDYDNPENGCPNCGRHRVMIGDDKKHRCEKCSWCVEDNDYDTVFSDFMR